MKKTLLLAVLLSGLLTGSLLAQDALRVNGANAIWAPLNKNVTALEAATGGKIAFVPNTAGRGLADLAEGKCDIAMVTFSIDSAAEGINKEKPGTITDLAAFTAETIGTEKIVFIVNKANTAGAITQSQVKDILTGKITNWKDVGGSDTPIVIVRLGITAGPQMTVESGILKGDKIPETAKMMKAPKDVPTVVAQLPGAIGYIGSNNLTESVKVAETDCNLTMSMMLVTKGAATATQRKFIDAAKVVMAGK